jgi:dephospho-CoA kinase
MKVIGIAGGVASGKSLVADGLKQLGAEVLKADLVGHEVLRESEVKEAIRQRWGDRVFDQQGEVKRPAVAKIVFAPPPSGPEELAYLEQITHPRIEQRLRARLAELAASQTKTVVLDAALMFKAGWDWFCDKIIFVETPRELRLARARQRGWSAAEFAAREAAQQAPELKRSRADVVIDNSGSPDATLDQLREFWRAYMISETRNSKSETNPKSELRMFKTRRAAFGAFEFVSFEFVSDFEFRVSDFCSKMFPGFKSR